MKKILVMVLSLVLCFGLLPMTSFSLDVNAASEVTIATQNDLNSAISNVSDATTMQLAAGTYTLPATISSAQSPTAKNITFTGNSDVIINVTSSITAANCTLTFDGVTVTFPNNTNYVGFQHASEVVYKNCVINGQQTMYASTVAFNNCVLNNTESYNVWTYAATEASFTDCTFNTGGRAILVYNELTNASFVANIAFANCKFIDDGTYTKGDKAAVETGINGGNTETSNKYNITFVDCTTSGFEANNSNSPLWGNKNSMNEETFNVVVDEVSAECTISGSHGEIVVLPAVEPTYTSTGLTEGSQCSVCKATIVPQKEVPKLNLPEKPAEKPAGPNTGDPTSVGSLVTMLVGSLGVLLRKRK